MRIGRMKGKTLKKALSNVKKSEARLLKLLRRNEDIRGNIFEVPSVKRAMKLHDKALKIPRYLRKH
jgi:hypothetical protein